MPSLCGAIQVPTGIALIRRFFFLSAADFLERKRQKGRIISRANAVRPRAIFRGLIHSTPNPNLTGGPPVADLHRSAFGRLIDQPAKLSHPQRVDVARQLSGSLQAADDPGLRWLGAGLGEWLRRGGDLAAVLGLRPDRGSHATAQEIMRRDAVRGLLLRLVNEVGSQSRAARILSGAEDAPADAAGLVAELRALRAPRCLRAIAEVVRPHRSGGRTA